MPDRKPPVLRTTGDDDLFIKMDAALGVPVVNQMVWRLTAEPSGAELEALTDRLRVGRLGRLLRRSRIPLVRDHWISDSVRSGRRVAEESTVPAGGLIGWIDSAASTQFDLIDGPVWELRSAPLSGGGAVVSLCVAHAAGDGAAALAAIRAALGAAEGSVFVARTPSPLDQIGDAGAQLGAIARNLTALARGAIADRVAARSTAGAEGPTQATHAITARTSRVLPHHRDAPDDSAAGLAPVCVVSVPTTQWNAVAREAGGSANALFIALVLGTIMASGRVGVDDTVRISVPMSLRSDDDDRANATLGLSLDLPASAARDRDLTVVRALSKSVYAQRTARPSTFVRLQPIVQALGDRTVAALSKGATTPLALASNLGTLDDHLCGLGDPARVGGIVTRSTTQAVTTTRLRELRGGLAAWANDSGGTTTMSVIGLDPDGLGRHSLREIVRAEFTRWSLEPQEW